MDYCLITFSSTHAAISAQKALEGICPTLVMPVLREISMGCGIAVRFDPPYFEAVQTVLAQTALPRASYAFYGVTGSGSQLSARPLE